MTDHISRQAAIDIAYPFDDNERNLIDALEELPSADAVEVVRCKDCRWYEINELKSDGTEDKRYKPSVCVLHSRSFRDNYYCADGERAEE